MIYIHTKGNVFPSELVVESKADKSKPYTTLSMPDGIDPVKLHCSYFSYDKNENYTFLEASYLSEKLDENIDCFRSFREIQFKAFDILKMNSLVGIDAKVTAKELTWYSAIKDFTNSITYKTIEADYPLTPARVSGYLNEVK